MKKRKRLTPREQTAKLLGGHTIGNIILFMRDIGPQVLAWEIAESGLIQTTPAIISGEVTNYALMDTRFLKVLKHGILGSGRHVIAGEKQRAAFVEAPKPKRRAKK